MLIVSQNKEVIVNFNQTHGIWVCDGYVKNKFFTRVFFQGSEEEFVDIAEYKTKEKAIKVLVDLAEAYKYGGKLFEMPKE